jgi:integrase
MMAHEVAHRGFPVASQLKWRTTVKLTAAAIAALQPLAGKTELIAFDDDLPGLGLRIRAGGTRTWIFQYRIGRKTRRLTIGNAGIVSLARARKAAAELHARVRLGGDPSNEKAESRRAAADTMGAALAAYMPHQKSRLKPLSYVQNERHLLKHCRPLHTIQLTKIDRRTIAARMSRITATSGPVESNRVRSSLAAFFAWCIREGLAETNPAAGGSRAPERSRDRVLTGAELRAIWAATADDRDHSAIVRLLMLTGCRANEIGGLRWSEIEGDRILLPASRTKNGRAHVVPLAPAARTILDGRPRRDDRDFVFGRQRDRGFTGWSATKAELDERLGAAVKPWVHHDARRAMASGMAELGIAPPHIIEALLNHVSGHKRGVAGIYNRADYEPQKRHALTAWADYLLAIVEGRAAPEKVVPLSAKRQV